MTISEVRNEIDKGLVDLALFPTQTEIWNNPSKLKLFLGGIGAGKTHLGKHWAYYKMRTCKAHGFIAANSYDQLSSATLAPFIELLEEFNCNFVVDKMPPKSWNEPQRFKKYHNILCYRDPSGLVKYVFLRSLDNFNMSRGIQIGWAWLDEVRDTKKKAFEMVLGRLRHPLATKLEMLLTTSPNGFDWLWETFEKNKLKNPDCFYRSASTRENKANPAEYVNTMLSLYDERLAAQEIDGKFINLTAGAVYYAFDRLIHVSLGHMLPDRTLPLRISFDFNKSPMTASICQIEPITNMFNILDEIYINDSNTPQVCREILNRYSEFPSGFIIYGDATQESKSATTGESDYAIIKKMLSNKIIGFKVGKFNPACVDRYAAVNGKFMTADGIVGIQINPECEHAISDFEQVIYKPGTSEMDKSNIKLTHMSDNIGYIIATEFPVNRKNTKERLALNIMRR